MKKLRISPELALPLDLVTEATAIVATRGAGKSSASAVIVEEGFAAGVQTVVFDRTGVYWGLRSGAAGTTNGGLPIYVLGGPHGDVPLETHAGTLIADLVVDSDHSFVLDLSDFSKNAAIKFAAEFLERLYDRKARARTTTLLIMDEAHFYAPQTPRGGFKGDAAKLMGAMEDAVGLGRSRGLGVVLTTQRTQSLNKAVLDLIETLLVMRMLSPRARDAVQDWIREKHEDDREGVIATLESLPTGTAWVWSPLRGILKKVAVRRIKTFDSYETPKPGQKRVEPKERTELNLEALGEQMRATAERAKANDPKELTRMNAELQRKLEDAERAIAVLDRTKATVETRVESVVQKINTPVFEKGEIEKLHDVAASLAKVARDVAGAAASIETAVENAARELVEQVRALDARERQAASVPVRRAETTERRETARQGRPGSSVAPVRPSSPPAAPRDPSDGLTGPEQRVLDALSWYEALGIRTPTKLQVGFVAGYRVGKKVGGTYGNILGTLRSQGLIEYPSNGAVALTNAGASLARDPGIGHGNDAMQNAVLARLDGPERRVLENLIRIHPSEISKQELGELSGYTVTEKIGGTYGNILGRLRSLGLIDYPGPGLAVATDVLFPEGA